MQQLNLPSSRFICERDPLLDLTSLGTPPDFAHEVRKRKLDHSILRALMGTSYFYFGYRDGQAKSPNLIRKQLERWHAPDLVSPTPYSQDRENNHPRIAVLPCEYAEHLPKKFQSLFLCLYTNSPHDTSWKNDLVGVLGDSTIRVLYHIAYEKNQKFVSQNNSRASSFRGLVDKVLTQNGFSTSFYDIACDDYGKEAFRLALCAACTIPLVSPRKILSTMEEKLASCPSAFATYKKGPEPAHLLNVHFHRSLRNGYWDGLPLLVASSIAHTMKDIWHTRKRGCGELDGEGEQKPGSQATPDIQHNLLRFIAYESVWNTLLAPHRWVEYLES